MTTRTEISKLGEFGLIEHLTQNMPLKNAETLKGVGDDAAVLDYKDKQVLVTTDLLLEGVHFDLTYVPLKHLGYKSAVVNFSDIYAMNGLTDQAVAYWEKAQKGSQDPDALKVKIECRKYMTESEIVKYKRKWKKTK